MCKLKYIMPVVNAIFVFNAVVLISVVCGVELYSILGAGVLLGGITLSLLSAFKAYVMYKVLLNE